MEKEKTSGMWLGTPGEVITSHRGRNYKVTPIRAIVATAEEMEREEFDVISSLMGEPDHAPDAEGIVAKLIHNARLPDYHNLVDVMCRMHGPEDGERHAENILAALNLKKEQLGMSDGYGPFAGLPELRKAAADAANKRFGGNDYTPECTMATVGANSGMNLALECMTDPMGMIVQSASGEQREIASKHRIGIVAPYFPIYLSIIVRWGLRLEYIDTSDTGLKLTPEKLEELIQKVGESGTIIFNYPNNPSGVQLTRKEYEALAEVLIRHPKVKIIDDGIYHRLTYGEGYEPITISDVMPREHRGRLIILECASKFDAKPGDRIGYVIAHPKLIAHMANSNLSYAVHPSKDSQLAHAADIRSADERMPAVAEHYRRQTLALINRLHADLVSNNPAAGFFVEVDLSCARGKPMSEGGKAVLRRMISEGIIPDDGVTSTAKEKDVLMDHDTHIWAELLGGFCVTAVPMGPFYPNPAESGKRMCMRLVATGGEEKMQRLADRLNHFRAVQLGEEEYKGPPKKQTSVVVERVTEAIKQGDERVRNVR